MLKLILFGTLLGLVVGQFNPQSYMMMQMMQNMAGGASGGASQGNSGGSSGGNDINGVFLCRNTANLRFVPCANYKEICDMISMRTYNMPNLLKCSALGTGCCLRDTTTLMLARNFAAS